MKTHSLILFLVLCITGCTQQTESSSVITTDNPKIAEAQPEETPEATQNDRAANESLDKDWQLLQHKLNSLKKERQTFTFDAQTSSLLVGEAGTRIHYEPGILVHTNGDMPIGEIRLNLIELQTSTDFAKNAASTQSDGRVLESDGSYHIEFTAAGQALKIKQGQALEVELPKGTSKPMILFTGRDGAGQMNWKPTQKKLADGQDYRVIAKVLISKSNTNYSSIDLMKLNTSTYYRPFGYARKVRSRKQVEHDELQRILRTWSPKELTAGERIHIDDDYTCKVVSLDTTLINNAQDIESHAVNNKLRAKMYKAVELTTLGWINCDRFYEVDLVTDLVVELDHEDINIAQSFLLFKSFNGALRKPILAKKTPGNAFKDIPVGADTRLVVLAVKDGKILAYSRHLTLKDSMTQTVQLHEISDEGLESLFEI